MAEGCWFCRDDRGEDAPPGGWLYDDGDWRAGHAPVGFAPAGTVVLETVDHVEAFAALSHQAAARMTEAIGRLDGAIRRAMHADRAYLWATMDAWPHLHLFLIPWWEQGRLRGPRYLAHVFTDSDGCTEDEADAAVRSLREDLG